MLLHRCPNPSACFHNATDLAAKHPFAITLNTLSWSEYERQLCDAKEGYTGVLCGVCLPGYGEVAPFNCFKCLSAQIDADKSPPQLLKPPSRPGISGLYVLYWFVLTGWCLFGIWSAMSSRPGADTTQSTPCVQGTGAVQSTQSSEAKCTTGTGTGFHEPDGHGGAVPCQGVSGASDTQLSGARALDVIKVRRALA